MASPQIASSVMRQLVKGDDFVKLGLWTVVNSTDVRAFRYSQIGQVLFIAFLRGAVYYYQNVDRYVAIEMYYAPSMGKFVHKLRRAGYIGLPLRGAHLAAAQKELRRSLATIAGD